VSEDENALTSDAGYRDNDFFLPIGKAFAECETEQRSSERRRRMAEPGHEVGFKEKSD
jgi:hypothetical protein